ncbi:hypothetical protein QYE76_058782 [Lolium multiflorum]|uniref:Plectin/eS10 N-terminal domain-containing protein n=2 Tax=Pooideae TaxID=147368 RepID=A0AAD8T7R1_LOLMU|nr:hypothetical protein QYE76_058782 [Lolium multiflorum]
MKQGREYGPRSNKAENSTKRKPTGPVPATTSPRAHEAQSPPLHIPTPTRLGFLPHAALRLHFLCNPAAPPSSSPFVTASGAASVTMIISKKNRREICKYLFQEGVLYAKKDYNLAKHPQVDASNLEVIKLMQSFKSKEYVRETFSWQHYYWYLTNDGIEFLRTFLNLPSEIVPNTLKKSAKPPSRPFGSGPPGDRPRGPPRFEGDRPRFGDRDGYRAGPRGAPGDFAGDKGGAPAEFQPSFRSGGGSRPAFGRGGGGAFGAGGASME